jgi:hypothetical protein
MGFLQDKMVGTTGMEIIKKEKCHFDETGIVLLD